MNQTTEVNSPARQGPVDRIPVTLLTGFLGAGKTTLLNHWMHQPGMSGVAVLVNEFGEVGIDHHLVDAVSDQMLLLDSGCLCCTVQGDLVAAFRKLSDRMARCEIAPISRVVIETTGLADPVPVLYTLMEEPFVCARYLCDTVIAAVSATQGLQQLDQHPESQRQVVSADRLLITKCDQASSTQREQLSAALQALNPQAEQVMVRHGVADLNTLMANGGVYGRVDVASSLQAWLGTEIARHGPSGLFALDEAAVDLDDGDGHYLQTPRRRSHHSARVRSFVITWDRPVAWLGFSLAMGNVLRAYAANLLRVKGLMRVAADEAHPWVVQCVQDVAYPPVRLAAWPQGSAFDDGNSRLVFIARDLASEQESSIRVLLSDFSSNTAALRASATDWELPTRCWLSQRVPIRSATDIEHEGWEIQARRFRPHGAGQ